MNLQLFNGQKNVLCDQILKYESDLLSPSKTISLNTCTTIISHFRNLNNITNNALSVNASKQKHIIDEHEKTVELYNKTRDEWKTSEKNLLVLQIKSSALESTKKSLKEASQKIKKKVLKLEYKVLKKKRKRKEGLIDMIPLAGFFGALATKRYKRMIPLYSPLKGLISVFTKDLESYKATLAFRKTEHKTVKNQIFINNVEILKARIDILKKKVAINNLGTRKNELDLETKKIGKNLTQLGELVNSLNALMFKYSSLQNDISDIKEYIASDFFFQEEMVQDFIHNVKRVRMTNL